MTSILGQVTETSPNVVGVGGKSEYFDYDADGRLVKITKSGPVDTVATLTYTTGQLTQVAFPLVSDGGNGATGTIGYDGTGAESSLQWSFTGSQNPVTDSVVRSQAGQILKDTLTDGPTNYVSTYTYDSVGRLVSATVPGNTLTYGFAASGGCGADAAAGEDGNRTSFTDTPTTGTAFSTAYCYDNADRLTSTAVAYPPSGADALEATRTLTSTGSTPTLAYDAHGNVTTLADETMTYNAANQVTGTTLADGTTETYGYDGSGRMVTQTTTPHGGTATVLEYSYNGANSSPDWILSGAGAVEDHNLGLPGGVTLDVQGSGAWDWSMPDLAGNAWSPPTRTAPGNAASPCMTRSATPSTPRPERNESHVNREVADTGAAEEIRRSGMKLLYQIFAGLLLAYASWRILVAVESPGAGGGDYSGYFLGLALVVGFVAWVDLRNALRVRALRQAYPSAFVSNFIGYLAMNPQVAGLTVLLGLPKSKFRAGWYASIVVDSSSIRFYGGSMRPKELFSVPTSALVGAHVVKRPRGLWNLDCLSLRFGSSDSRSDLDVCLLRTKLGIPRNVASPALDLRLAEVRKFVQPLADEARDPGPSRR